MWKVSKSISHSVVSDSLRTPWNIAHQAPLSMEFFRQEYWSRLPFPSPGDLLDPGIKSRSPALQADSLLSESPGKPIRSVMLNKYNVLSSSTMIKIWINYIQFWWAHRWHCFYFLIFNWRITALQYCLGFCHTTGWISRKYTDTPFLLNLPPPHLTSNFGELIDDILNDLFQQIPKIVT